ncbi:hypothetical protein ACHWQZ_G019551 [Mnemiopsis leidyi]
MLRLPLLFILLARDVLSSTICQTEGPDYWCSSCVNARTCSPEIDGLLKFCQQDLRLLLDCEIPINYQGYAEGSSSSGYRRSREQEGSYDFFTGPYSREYDTWMMDGAYPGSDQFYGDPEDSIRSLNLDNFREEYFVSGLPAFDRQLLQELEDRTAMQWGYSGEALATTAPRLPDPTSPEQESLFYTQSPVTQTLQNPFIIPPIITRPLYNISAYVGQATVLSCEAESDTENMGVSIAKLSREPKKSWLKKDKKGRDSEEESEERTAITAFLTIDHLDEVDGGWYVCMAINGGGRARSLMYLDITDLCKDVECEGHETCLPNYQTKETTCSCPRCENDLEMVCGSNCKTYQNDCWLARDNCQLGTNHSMMIHAPCPRVMPPVFTVEPSDVEIEEGHHLFLECHALSFPVATYQWFKINPTGRTREVGSGTQYKVEEAALEDSGEYFCVASICEGGHTIKSRIARVETEHNLSTKSQKIKNRVCRVFGDPHIMTFDRNNYNFPGECTYILNMDCQLARWSVYGKFENCSGIGMQGSCLQSVTIVYDSSAIELQRGWSINHMGNKIDFFETQQNEVENFHFDLDENLNLHVTMENGATIIWDGLYSVQIKLSEKDDTRYCGLCGDGDGNSANDMMSSQTYWRPATDSKETHLGIFDFGESWKIDPYRVCSDWRALASPRSRCTKEEETKGRERCEYLFSHHLILPCRSLDIDTDFFISSCVEDLCAMRKWGDKLDPDCGVLSAYTSACRALDFYIDDNLWREEVGCSSLKEHQDFVITTGCPKTTQLTY